MDNIAHYILGIASKSNSEKRQVGCVIWEMDSKKIVGEGWNVETRDQPEDPPSQVLHAEIMALEDAYNNMTNTLMRFEDCIVYVSHPPCPDCAKKLAEYNVHEVKVVDAFMKFDGDKTRFDLIPPKFTEAIAKVLTLGARKYKPNNWRKCQDMDRYIGGLHRHINLYQNGEIHDTETGVHHLVHAACNAMFIAELEEEGYYAKETTETDTDK